ncbi:MAG: hypothetical protein B7X99_03125 [Rhizobiales bacterium 17-65-6]|nr:MAG: hypothetical protein B7Y84_11305 [Azorhizobium sp. 32-67-21]OZA00728.1 MAG: hypothetical protein B7X99_03125 [Rhizobiales bacterium 17-65-6]
MLARTERVGGREAGVSVRYAIYLAPPADSALWAFGSAIIGYDAGTGADLDPPDLCGFDAATWHDLTAEPRRYGFHGTLKAPFRLAEGVTEDDLFSAAAKLAQGHHAFELSSLDVQGLGSFIAIVPGRPVPALMDLAADAVVHLDHLRAPLSPEEVARRRPDSLSHRQRELLGLYGYPYVLDEFRFHMTLTGPLPPDVQPHALNALCDAYAASAAPLPVEVADIAVYRQDASGGRFRILHRAPLRRV